MKTNYNWIFFFCFDIQCILSRKVRKSRNLSSKPILSYPDKIIFKFSAFSGKNLITLDSKYFTLDKLRRLGKLIRCSFYKDLTYWNSLLAALYSSLFPAKKTLYLSSELLLKFFTSAFSMHTIFAKQNIKILIFLTKFL